MSGLEFNLENVSQLLNDLSGELAEKKELDQAKLVPESVFERIRIMKDFGDLERARVLCIGDFDLTGSLASVFGGTKEVVVADIDERIAEILFEINFEYDSEIRFVYHDMRKKMIEILRNEFEVVITEPPPTIEGLELFFKRAVVSVIPLREGKEGVIYISIPSGEEFKTKLSQLVADSNGTITHVFENINRYLNSSKTSDFYRIVYDENKVLLGNDHYLGPLYSSEVAMIEKPWLCKCGKTIFVGPNSEFKSLKELEEKGCPDCGYKGPFRFKTEIEIK